MEYLREDLIQKTGGKHDKVKLLICIILAVLVFIAEAVGAFLSGSLAITTVALNCLSDISIFLVGFICSSLNKTKSERLSFGYQRVEILSYLMTIALVWPIFLWIMYESFMVIIKPGPVNSLIMLICSVIGLVYNIVTWSLIVKNQTFKQNPYKALYINMKTKHTHVLVDLIESFIITLVASLIYFDQTLHILDPLCAILICLISVYSSIRAFSDIIGVLMEKSPVHIDLVELRRQLKHVEGVHEMHDLHVWTIGLGTVYLSCHFIGKNREDILLGAKGICSRFGIYQSIIQVEDPEASRNLNCESSLRL
jgi:cation diffusion facilitator family transporter